MMAIAPDHTLFDEITDFLASAPAAEQIIAFKLSSEIEKRALDLLELNRQNHLTPDERDEMNAFVQMDHFMTVLKAKARLKLAGKT
jgi:hypothetical protein